MTGTDGDLKPGPGLRPGEVVLPFDPALAQDAGVAFIGRIRSPWRDDGSCPKNLRQAHERGGHAVIELDRRYWQGLRGLPPGSHVILLYWMDGSRRDLILQCPHHRDQPVGTFGLRSPARPNPVAIAVATLLAIDPDAGTLTIDAIDCHDGTPLLDIKPWLPSVDIPPGWRDAEEYERATPVRPEPG